MAIKIAGSALKSRVGRVSGNTGIIFRPYKLRQLSRKGSRQPTYFPKTPWAGTVWMSTNNYITETTQMYGFSWFPLSEKILQRHLAHAEPNSLQCIEFCLLRYLQDPSAGVPWLYGPETMSPYSISFRPLTFRPLHHGIYPILDKTWRTKKSRYVGN